MKQLKAILQPNALPRVIRALPELPRFPGLTVFDAVGQGRGHGAGGTFVLTEENLFFHHKKVVEIIAEDDLATGSSRPSGKRPARGTRGTGWLSSPISSKRSASAAGRCRTTRFNRSPIHV